MKKRGQELKEKKGKYIGMFEGKKWKDKIM